MDNETIRRLTRLNNEFYRENVSSFSKSRHASWPGWNRVCESFNMEKRPFRILDAASGNMRFERYMLETFQKATMRFTCLDACSKLAQLVEGVTFVECDLIETLLSEMKLPLEQEACFDASVSFGFMHHIPSFDLRASFAHTLASTVAQNGIVALSFWRFMSNPDLAEKAQRATANFLENENTALEQNDYILGWNGRPNAYRYCHHFTEEEIDSLAESLSDICEVHDCFHADGRTGSLNTYLVLRRR